MTESRFEPVRTPPALSRTPHGRAFYAAIWAFSILATCAFSYAVVAAPTGTQRLAEAVLALVFAGGLLQTSNRLFRPREADRVSVGLPESKRRSLLTLGTAMVRISLGLFLGGALMHISSSDQITGLGTDLQIFASVLAFAAWCVADVCGDRLQALKRTFRM